MGGKPGRHETSRCARRVEGDQLIEEIRLINQLEVGSLIPFFTGCFSTIPVVQDFLHQQYAVNVYFYKCMLYIYIYHIHISRPLSTTYAKCM